MIVSSFSAGYSMNVLGVIPEPGTGLLSQVLPDVVHECAQHVDGPFGIVNVARAIADIEHNASINGFTNIPGAFRYFDPPDAGRSSLRLLCIIL